MSESKPFPARCVAVVQCHISHERCAGIRCAVGFARREHHFASYGPEGTYYVPFTCGGCPGRRVSRLAVNLIRKMKQQGVEREHITVHLASCIVHDSFHYPPCPHADYMRRILKRRGLRVVEGTYVSAKAEARRRSGEYDKDA